MGATKLLPDTTIFERLADLAESEGSARHGFLSLPRASDASTGRTLADAVHHLSQLHGRHIGVIECLSDRRTHPGLDPWLARAREAMHRERDHMTRILVAAGPVPSTLHHDRSEAELAAMRHAIEMLGRSERVGCAIGAALMLTLDWPSAGRLLDAAALRFGIDPVPGSMPTLDESAALLGPAMPLPGAPRAVLFGAQQLLLQHQALWDLLARREASRLRA